MVLYHIEWYQLTYWVWGYFRGWSHHIYQLWEIGCKRQVLAAYTVRPLITAVWKQKSKLITTSYYVYVVLAHDIFYHPSLKRKTEWMYRSVMLVKYSPRLKSKLVPLCYTVSPRNPRPVAIGTKVARHICSDIMQEWKYRTVHWSCTLYPGPTKGCKPNASYRVISVCKNYGPTCVSRNTSSEPQSRWFWACFLLGSKSIQLPGDADVQFNDKCLWNSLQFHQDEILSKPTILSKQAMYKKQKIKWLYRCVSRVAYYD